MMKKIICLMLAMLMVVPLLASCGDDDDAVDNITSDASQYTTTLNMWVVTESELVVEANRRVREGYKPEDVPDDKLAYEDMTDKQKIVSTWSTDQQNAFLQVFAIEDAINDLTKSKFKTRIKLYYQIEDDYYEKLEGAFNEHQAAIEDGSFQKADTSAGETEMIDGIPQLKYPETMDYVVDIFYLDGYERYLSYIDQKLVADMTTLLETDAVEIGKYINSAFMDAVKYKNFTYAIPNYHEVGEYTYLMINKEMLNEYGRVPSDIAAPSIYDGECKTFLDYIYQDKDNVYPIYTDSADAQLDIGNVYYWNHDLGSAMGTKNNKDRFSIFGDVFAADAIRGTALSYDSLLADQEYMELLATKRYYESAEGFVTNDPAEKFKAAACVVKGDWELRREYEEQGYVYYVMEMPRITTEDVFSSMFAIGGKTGYANRAMEIVAYLNTNSEVRNLLQYGVQDVNYTLDSVSYVDGDTVKNANYVVETRDNLYKMNINKTGNVFLAYPLFTEEEVAALTDVEDEELANARLLEAIRVKTTYKQEKCLDMLTDPTLSMYYTFNSATGTYGLDVESVAIVAAVSARVEQVINTMDDVAVSYFYAKYNGVKSDLAATAAMMITDFGGDITYQLGDETKTVTAETLATALESMADGALVDDGEKPEENDNLKESPNAFYQAWLAAFTAGL